MAAYDKGDIVMNEVAKYRAGVYENIFNTKIYFDNTSKSKEKYLYMDYL